MNRVLVNTLVLATMAVIVAFFEFGGLAPADAFFAVLAVLIGYTAWRFLDHVGKPTGDAVRAVFSPPRSRGAAMGYLAYVGVGAMGLLVIVQSVTTTL